MRSKFFIVFAVVGLFAVTLAAPASATASTRHGDFDVALYLTPCSPEDPESPLLTWAGIIDFEGKELGLAWFPTSELEPIGETGWVYFEDELILFRLPKGELTDEKMIAAACNPRREILRGEDAGVGTPWGKAFAVGSTTWARGPWQQYVGGEIFWDGEYTSETFDTFGGTLWLMSGMIS